MMKFVATWLLVLLAFALILGVGFGSGIGPAEVVLAYLIAGAACLWRNPNFRRNLRQ